VAEVPSGLNLTKSRKCLVRIFGVLAEIRTGLLQSKTMSVTGENCFV
jgi:hypothetical protein